MWIAAGIIMLLAALGLALFFWAKSAGSAATLDRVDALLSGNTSASLLRDSVRYGDQPAQRLSVMAPPDAPASAGLPVIIFFHGGGWDSGDQKDYRFVARGLVPKGYVVVVAGYRLGPEGRFPAMLEDSAKAVRWVHDHIAALGGDPRRITLVGHSAGAYNALMLALDRQWLGREGLGDDAISGVVGLAGPTDFYPWTNASARAALGGWHRPQETQPIHHARGDAVPLLLLHGTADETVKPRNSQVLARSIVAAGGAAQVQLFAGLNHADIVMKLARPFSRDPAVIDAIDGFARANAAPVASASAKVQAQSAKATAQ